MSFVPYEPEKHYKAILTKDEAVMLEEIRKVGFGTVTIHISAKKIIRLETTNSILVKDIANISLESV